MEAAELTHFWSISRNGGFDQNGEWYPSWGWSGSLDLGGDPHRERPRLELAIHPNRTGRPARYSLAVRWGAMLMPLMEDMSTRSCRSLQDAGDRARRFFLTHAAEKWRAFLRSCYARDRAKCVFKLIEGEWVPFATVFPMTWDINGAFRTHRWDAYHYQPTGRFIVVHWDQCRYPSFERQLSVREVELGMGAYSSGPMRDYVHGHVNYATTPERSRELAAAFLAAHEIWVPSPSRDDPVQCDSTSSPLQDLPIER